MSSYSSKIRDQESKYVVPNLDQADVMPAVIHPLLKEEVEQEGSHGFEDQRMDDNCQPMWITYSDLFGLKECCDNPKLFAIYRSPRSRLRCDTCKQKGFFTCKDDPKVLNPRFHLSDAMWLELLVYTSRPWGKEADERYYYCGY